MRNRHTLDQQAKLKSERRRKKERRQRARDAWKRQQDEIRRQIEEARRRRQRFLFWILVGLLAGKIAASLFGPRPAIRQPEPKKPRRKDHSAPPSDFPYPDISKEEWDEAVARTYKNWSRYQKKLRRQEWKNDPEFSDFPTRHQGFGSKPTLFQLVRELGDEKFKSDALKALLLIAPPETRTWLREAYVLDPGQIRRAFAKKSDEIEKKFREAAVRWEAQKEREARDQLTLKSDFSKKNDAKNPLENS